MTTSNQCSYCHTPLVGQYCHQCGLLKPQLPLRMSSLWHDFYERVIQFETSFFRSCFWLLFNPTRIIRPFLQGVRRTYTHPFTLLLLLGTLNVLASSGLQPDFLAQFKTMMAGLAPSELNTAQQQRFLDFYLRLFNLLPYWMLLFTLPTALLLRLFRYRATLHSAEYWMLCLYGTCQALLLDLLWLMYCRWQALDAATQNNGTNLLLLFGQFSCLLVGMGWRGWRIPAAILAITFSYAAMGLMQYQIALLYAKG